MSLSSFALRIIISSALRGKTLAGDKVFDSPQDPVDVLEKGATIAIYSGESRSPGDGRSLLGIDQVVDLSVHLHLPDAAEMDAGTGVLFATRKSSEAIFDIMWRQVTRALLLDDDPWPTLFRRFVNKISDLEARPFLIESKMEKIRFQAREVVFAADLIYEPDFGPIDEGSPWATLLALMSADPELAALADLLQQQIEAPDGTPSWQTLKAALGYTVEDMQAMGLAPLDIPLPAEPVAADVFTVTDDVDTFTVDETTPDPGQVP